MECERLQRLVKSWYIQVQDEAMAPARMISLIEKHIIECHACLADPLVRAEVDRITAIVLPPAKVRKPPVKKDVVPVPDEQDAESDDQQDDKDASDEAESDDQQEDEEASGEAEETEDDEENDDEVSEIDDDAIDNVD